MKQVIVPVRGNVVLESHLGDVVAVSTPNDLVEIAEEEHVSIAGGGDGVRFVLLAGVAVESSTRFDPPEPYVSPVSVVSRRFELRNGVIETHWGETCPFPIRRVYFTHSAANGSRRGGHAHRSLRQILVAMDGSIEVAFRTRTDFSESVLSCSHEGMYVAPLTWRDITMGDGGFLFVMASDGYSEDEYIRDEREFAALVGQVPGTI